MNVKGYILKSLAILWSLLLVFQIIYLWNMIKPRLGNDHIVTKGMACTCPDATVIVGQDYLKDNTPDSLKRFDLDYTEVYFDERPATNWDPMGVDKYIVYGTIIGKERVSDTSLWNPVFQVTSFVEEDLDVINFFRIAILVQIVIVIFIFLQSGNRRTAQFESSDQPKISRLFHT